MTKQQTGPQSRGVVQISGDMIGSTVIIIDNTGRRSASGTCPVTVSSVLTVLDQLERDTRIRVLDFLDREFGTRMVKDLGEQQLTRAMLYVTAILKKNENRQPRKASNDTSR